MSENERPIVEWVLEGWLLEVGEDAQYCDGVSYRKIGRGSKRAEAFKILIGALASAGYTEDEICSNQVENKLKDACIPPEWRTQGYGKEVRRWKNIIGEEWGRQLRNVYGEKYQKYSKYAKKFIPKEEPKEKLPPLEPRPVLDPTTFVGGDDTPVDTIEEVDQDFLDAISVKKDER